ncbi:cbb3-type cytochrome oxidase subunit 3 [Motilimonas eburnea]|uniref:cbb3-type cytochrome oxidase subunit 3 n=1 Tax=Motilimonas eburnea TaxID=1737488 RepID=UPI001E618617|nr:cbb3-type cytochrome c oxidase subunit 3 [Motilimonas eburnea]MCE2570405.1 cbb3-type cytochrome c oxidase subunit 3 [Motilimonas eburnea]
MDYGTFSGLYTGFLIVIFIGIIAWAYSSKNKSSFDKAANLVFADDEAVKPSADNKNAGANL